LGWSVVDGQRRRKAKRKKGFKTKKDALSWLHEFDPAQNVRVPTMSQLWETFTNNADLSASKLSAYKIAWNKIKNIVGHRTVDSFSADELQDITDDVANTYYTARDVKNLLSHFYKLALRDDLVDKNKAQFIKLPPQTKTERPVFTSEHIATLWANYHNAPVPVVAAALIMLYTGMRTGEIKQLDAANVHFDEHYLTGGIKTEKGKNRKIIIPDKIAPVLRWYLNADKPHGKNYLAEQWETKRAEFGLSDNYTLYCCRHTYLTRLTSLNASPAMLQELAGHEDYDTTLNYTHLSVAERLELVNKL
jgi:site-specific recombinase XerD